MYYAVKKKHEKEAVLSYVIGLIERMPADQKKKIEVPVKMDDYGKHWRNTMKPEKKEIVVDCGEYDLYGAYEIMPKERLEDGEFEILSTVVFDCWKAVKHCCIIVV